MITLNLTFPVFCLLLTVEKREKDSMIEKRYTIENVIGNGGFGTVYAGRRKKDGLLVSLFFHSVLVFVYLTLTFHKVVTF